MRLILATNNKHKVEEYKDIVGEKYKDKLFTLAMLDIHINPEENGDTLEENATIKVNALYNYMKEKNLLKDDDFLLSDDTGLFIDYLNGEPGIHSARFMGENTSQEIKNKEIIKRLEKAKGNERRAHFSCVIASIYKNKLSIDTGFLYGKVSTDIKNGEGFGYDPIFFVEEKGMTFAEMGRLEKNKISHRYKAFHEFAKRYNLCDINSD